MQFPRKAVTMGLITSILLVFIGLNAAVVPARAQAPVHDVAIVFVWLSKTFITAGETVTVYADVTNQGDQSESVDVHFWYDGNHIVGFPGIPLAPGETKTLDGPWNTAGVPAGAYQVTARATPVPGETDTTDNEFSTLAIVKEPEAPLPPVGGLAAPINIAPTDKFALLASYIGLVSVIASAVAVSSIVVKRKREQQT